MSIYIRERHRAIIFNQNTLSHHHWMRVCHAIGHGIFRELLEAFRALLRHDQVGVAGQDRQGVFSR